MQHKLVPLDGALEFIQQPQARAHRALDSLIEDFEPILSIGLCRVHREVRAAQQFATAL